MKCRNAVSLWLALLAAGCACGAPSGNGVLMMGVVFQPSAGTVMEGATSLRITAARVEAVFDDGAVVALVSKEHTFTFGALDSGLPVLIGEYNVRPGHITQLRLLLAGDQSISLSLPSGTTAARIANGPPAALRIQPRDGSSFAITADQTTAVEIQFDPLAQLTRDGEGLTMQPTLAGTVVDPSVFAPYPLDQFMVGFKAGTSESTMAGIHDGFHAVVLNRLAGIHYTLVRVPASASPSDVLAYYGSKDEVSYVLPNFSMFPQRHSNDPAQPSALDVGRVDAYGAWDVVAPAPKRPGSHRVLVAVADSGVALNHPDLANNIHINQKEMAGWFGAAPTPQDTDGDGVISFADLNDPTSAVNQQICDAIRNNDGDPRSCGPLDLVDGRVLGCRPCTGINRDQPPTGCTQGFGWQNGCDDDCDGKCDDLVGWDFTEDNNLPMDRLGHGTAVAGEIGAVGNNGLDLVAPAWDVGIIPYKVINDYGNGGANAFVSFVDVARRVDGGGVDIANISADVFQPRLGGTPPSACQNDANLAAFLAPLRDCEFGSGVQALKKLWLSLDAERILFTVAAGNCRWNMDNVDVFVFPASLRKSLALDNMLVVSTTSDQGLIWSDLTESIVPRPIGPQSIDLVVPSDEGCVLSLDGKYTCTCGDASSRCAGTSFAAPMVASVAVLVLQQHPELKGHPDLIAAKINSTVRPSPAMEPIGFPSAQTANKAGGMLSALGAVQ